ncbi:DUF4389 domain-containing protein [Halopseudomonas pelagia]|uniref:DUF4389 domain-containing protein n=1 Tax=Halopseudomonas pelagia TaxID=553151 RepID=A0AA91U4J4_9GAMM|nr:DUF4389 domain-containing protein [Halopseudomonas pelagia]PCD00252.1 lipase [Halopseudomonas pelagia]QFY56912.1 DUF4389 domain-containing protein [Halopseudomonas pelagia]
MSKLNQSVGSADFWLRLLYTLLLALAWQVTELLLIAVVILQIGYRVFTAKADPRLAEFGSSLSAYAAQIGRYVTGASEQKPWPFMEWPTDNTAAPVSEAPAEKI